jgi:AAA+ ATPase superfamily predicted ATPase
MNDEQVKDMLKDLVQVIDISIYPILKYVNRSFLEILTKVVRHHVNEARLPLFEVGYDLKEGGSRTWFVRAESRDAAVLQVREAILVQKYKWYGGGDLIAVVIDDIEGNVFKGGP